MKKALLGTFSLLISCAVATRGQTSADEHTQRIAWEPYQDRAVRLLQEYLRIDTSNPPGNELKAALTPLITRRPGSDPTSGETLVAARGVAPAAAAAYTHVSGR